MTEALGNNRLVRYLRRVRTEVRKVTWPSRDEVVRMSTIVVIVLLVMSVFMAVIDYGFSWLMRLIISLGAGL